MKIVFAFLLIWGLQAQAARPEISIPATVEVSQRPVLRLGDIAVLKNGNEALLAQMDAVVLREDARELLLSQHFEAKELLTTIKNALNENEDLKSLKPAFKIPTQVKVNFAAALISKQEVQRRIQNFLSVRCESCEYNISVQNVPIPATRQWDLDMTQLSPKGGFLLPVRDGENRQIKWISGTIRVSRLTPVAMKLIQQGERLNAQDLQMAMVDVTFAKDSSLRIEDIQGQLAVRALPVGSPVWSSDLKREPAAKRGQIVKALIGDDSFEISVNVQAEDNGFVGDIIKVKNMETSKILSAVVTDKGVVKLQ